MIRFLLFTTTLTGFLAGMANVGIAAGTITTTTTAVWTQDFPDGPGITTTSTETEENCTVECQNSGTEHRSWYDDFGGDAGLIAMLEQLYRYSPKKFNVTNLVEKAKKDGGMTISFGGGSTGLIIDFDTGCYWHYDSGSCFAYDALVLMADKSVKKVGEIAAGDETAYGIVHQTFIRRFDQSRAAARHFHAAYRGGLYNYRGILVTGNHAVRDGERWMQVADTREAVPVSADETAHIGNVYNLDVEGGIIPVINPGGELIAFLDDKQPFVLRQLTA